ncbi:hypothetical protein DKX38_028906 [Salix brachista]|uniref:Uncharacterized protein n=1 Tax=Salix brachista TaxID=2182728 RepID=A0A5N5IXR9_9ROSI|nr:hypothetical protein DKX38_028906 [Salix brachista]
MVRQNVEKLDDGPFKCIFCGYKFAAATSVLTFIACGPCLLSVISPPSRVAALGKVAVEAYVLQELGSLPELVDPELGSEYSSEEAMVTLNVTLLCTNASPTFRFQCSGPSFLILGFLRSRKHKAIRNHFRQNPIACLQTDHAVQIPQTRGKNLRRPAVF